MGHLGYGAGLAVQQATDAVRVIPQLLAMHHDDAMKPSMLYFIQNLKLPYDLFDEARAQLSSYVSGATASDAWTFAYLRSLDVSWEQMKILLDAFPTLVCCETEPSWELIDDRYARSVYKESDLHYLRKRLQISPGEVFAMIKVRNNNASFRAFRYYHGHFLFNSLSSRLTLV